MSFLSLIIYSQYSIRIFYLKKYFSNFFQKNTDRNLTNQLGQMQRASKNYSGGGGGNSNNKHNRYSWGSGHSSSSLHSSAATLGIGSGKDDLWAAIQTNYNYIMDTNLLDSCKEARCEIEGATSGLNNTTETCLKVSVVVC